VTGCNAAPVKSGGSLVWDFSLLTGDRWGGDGDPLPSDLDLLLDLELEWDDLDRSEELE